MKEVKIYELEFTVKDCIPFILTILLTLIRKYQKYFEENNRTDFNEYSIDKLWTKFKWLSLTNITRKYIWDEKCYR